MGIGLTDFIGNWSVSRVISDALGDDLVGGAGRFDGYARFVEAPGGLRYHEEGQLMLPGQGAFTATRQYLWRANGARIAVLFDDQRPFHEFDPGLPDPAAIHLCPPDTYRVAYDFAAWPRWQARWNVSGPRKAYTMLSCYAPCAGAETSAKA